MKHIIWTGILFCGWMFFLQQDIPVGKNFLPATGRFFHPGEGIWKSTSTSAGDQTFKGNCSSPVAIQYDERDIPHIYAGTLKDALYAQGYVHAANRLFSMDLSTRSPAGRISELLGPGALQFDRRQREKGYLKLSEEKAKFWLAQPGTGELITSYVNGVNDYIRSLEYEDWPVEYKILGLEPELWDATRVALMSTNMAISLCLKEHDHAWTRARQELSPELFAFLYPVHNPLESPVIPAEKTWDFTNENESAPEEGTTGSYFPSPNQNDDRHTPVNGSNNWAISGSRTANGYPILANDPHLNLTLPSIWYEMEIHTPEMNAHGVTLPGLPFIILGFNDHVAWGSTNSGQDVLDWYKITWQDSSRKKYVLDGAYVDAELRPETIRIRGTRPVVDSVRYTVFGPVSSFDQHKDMAMKWIVSDRVEVNDVDYLIGINTARNVSDYRKAVAAFPYPAQNKVFASTEGDIAITVAGIMPIRSTPDPELIQAGDQSAHNWTGYIPFEHAPYIINPERGYVSSANQYPAATDYPYPMPGRKVFEDYRGRILNILLDSVRHATVEDVKQIQQNNFNLQASELLPLMIDAVKQNDCHDVANHDLFKRLTGWNYESHRDSVSPPCYELWYDEFLRFTFDELNSLKLMYPEEWRFIELVRDHPQHVIFDLQSTPDHQERMTDILCMAFDTMLVRWNEIPPGRQKNWGQFKQTHINHLGRFPGFGVDSLHVSGAPHVLNAMGTTHGPSWRMIVELSTPPKAWVNYPGGQSGDPANPHYRDFVESFFEGEYFEVSLRNDPDTWTSTRRIQIEPK